MGSKTMKNAHFLAHTNVMIMFEGILHVATKWTMLGHICLGRRVYLALYGIRLNLGIPCFSQFAVLPYGKMWLKWGNDRPPCLQIWLLRQVQVHNGCIFFLSCCDCVFRYTVWSWHRWRVSRSHKWIMTSGLAELFTCRRQKEMKSDLTYVVKISHICCMVYQERDPGIHCSCQRLFHDTYIFILFFLFTSTNFAVVCLTNQPTARTSTVR